MPVDTSFYNTQPPQPVIPGGVPGVVGLSNMLAQGRVLNTEGQMLQQDLGSRMAIGNAYQQSLNPDGTVNTTQLDHAIAGSPAAAYGAPQAYAGAASLQGANLANQGAAVSQAQGRMNDFYNSIGALPPEQRTYSNVMGLAANLLHQGRLLPQDVVAINGEVPLDNSGVQNYVQNKFTSALSPGQQSTPRTIGIDPNTGQPIQGTTSQFLSRATAPGGMPGGGVVTSLPVGQSESIKQNVTAFNSDQQQAAATMANLRKLQSAYPLIESLSHSAFGPGSQEFNQVKAALQTLGVILPGTQDTEVRQEANKYLLSSAGSAIGAGRSDEGLAQALRSNPNLDLTQGANLTLIRNQIGMDRQDAALPFAFSLANPNPSAQSKYLNFKSGYYGSTDRRAFIYDLYSPQERRQLIDSLGSPTSAPYKKFVASYNLAKQAGQFNPPQGAQ